MGGKHKPDIFRNRSPGQQPRLLENDSEASARDAPLAGEIRIEPGGDVQDCRFAAAGRTDHRAKAAGFKPQVQPADNLDGRALGRNKGLGVDAKFKRAGAAIGLFVVQAVAPAGFRSRAKEPRTRSHSLESWSYRTAKTPTPEQIRHRWGVRSVRRPARSSS